MPWFKVDEAFHQHPKVNAAGNPAIGLWLRCATYSAQYLTDGHIPTHIATSYGKPREIEALLTVGLWAREDGGYHMPDYLDYNPSADTIRQQRKIDAERKRNAGRKGGRPKPKPDSNRDPFDD